MGRREHLIDSLDRAEIQAPAPNHVEVQRACVGRDARMSIFQHPPSRVVFPALALGPGAVLLVATGVKPRAWQGLRGAVEFEIAVDGRRVLRRSLDPARRAEDRAWRDERVDLSRFAGRAVRLEFRTGGATAWAWAVWGDPCIEHDAPARARGRPDARRHVFLVTADALGADRLRAARAPNLDRLAEDGARCEHVRVQSPTTIGSYASMLTGVHGDVHGLNAEWGCFPSGLPSLPGLLRAGGFHAAMIASERELSDPHAGFAGAFDEVVPCAANPAQDGAVTTRAVERWLDARPDRPCFAWIQYFDAHPPSTPPEPYRSMYYAGDPTDPSKRHRPEQVRAIRGVEVVQAFEQALPVLEAGGEDAMLAFRLRDTADALRGRRHEGPDLAAHLPALGPSAMRGLGARAFGEWLAKQVDGLMSRRAVPELLAWMRAVVPALRGIEADILAWLDGVVDSRYPEAQHLGAISYLDAQLGALVAALKERGLYDESAIVFMSPHGEIMNTLGIHFHHHALFESVLRVPLVIKAPGARAGARVDGVFDGVDLLPTLAEALGVAAAPVDGVSRWANVRDGSAIAPHPSVSVANHGVMWSWTEDGHKLVRAEHPHTVSPQWRWKPGESALFDLADAVPEERDRSGERPELAAELERRLDAWRSRRPRA